MKIATKPQSCHEKSWFSDDPPQTGGVFIRTATNLINCRDLAAIDGKLLKTVVDMPPAFIAHLAAVAAGLTGTILSPG